MKANPISMKSYEDLFGTLNTAHGELIEVDPDELYTFKDHSFKVKKDARFMETLESIQKVGVLEPGIARKCTAGGYEIIAGHRRRECCKILGIKVPVFIRNVDDEDAVIMMADTNLYREDISFSEKAHAYYIKSEAMKAKREKRKNQLTEENGIEDVEIEEYIRTDELLAKQFGESRNTIQRYIRLVNLVDVLLELVDDKKIGFIAGAELSYLTVEEQEELCEYIFRNGIMPNGTQATQLKEYSKKKELNKSVIELILNKDDKKASKVVLQDKTLKKYFSDDYKKEDIEEIIINLLEKWKEGQ